MTIVRLGMRAGAIALAAAAGVGCGGGSDSGVFDDGVAAVRSAVETGDDTAAREALDALALHALAAHENGAITRAELEEVASHIDASRKLLPPAPTTTTTTTTTTVPPAPAPAPAPENDDRGEGEDDDKGNQGKGNEGRGNEGKGDKKRDEDGKDDDD